MRTVLVLTIPVLLMSAGCSGSSSSTYRCTCVVFDKSPATVIFSVDGKPEVCKALFAPPNVYIGPVVDIPETASVWGGLVVSHGNNIKAVPLYTWKDDEDKIQFGCNGPTPSFAQKGKSRDEFVNSIAKYVGMRGK
jgi:hypothetical protein